MKIQLSEKEQEVYKKIEQCGTMEEMFEIGYRIGKKRDSIYG